MVSVEVFMYYNVTHRRKHFNEAALGGTLALPSVVNVKYGLLCLTKDRTSQVNLA